MLEWNVYTYDFNERTIRVSNILNDGRLIDDIRKAFIKYGNDRDKFEDEVKGSLMYRYWSRCEYEIIISSWPPSDSCPGVKIDVFDQIMLNWNAFIGYIVEHKPDIMKVNKQ